MPRAYVCGIRADATLICTPTNHGAEPPGGEFLQVDHYMGPPCALRTDRTIVCWDPHGHPSWDVLVDPPKGEFSHIAVGAHHACAIRVDGTVACWGENSEKPRRPYCTSCTGDFEAARLDDSRRGSPISAGRLTVQPPEPWST